MNKSKQLASYCEDFKQYNYILSDEVIRKRISDFLLQYISIEAFYKKLLIAQKEGMGKKMSGSDKKKLSVRETEVNRVLEYFDISCDKQLVKRLFGSNDNNYMECSIKKLRDRLVHRINENVLKAILERYDDMKRDMDKFMELFVR